MAVGRYAPSPTGDLHVGNLRTALLAQLFALKSADPLLLRIDDLDPSARKADAERAQLDDLAAIGIRFDGSVLRQSERTEVYLEAIQALDAAGLTYPCFCSRREVREAASAPHDDLPDGAYPGTCRDLDSPARVRLAERRPAALRVRAGAVSIEFTDHVYGATTTVVDDFVIRRNDGVPSYNLATVIDDAAQGVAEVIRGEDLRNGTGRQIWLQRQLGLPSLGYAHVPLIVNSSGRRLAKRDGDTTLGELRSIGWTAIGLRSVLAASLGLCRPEDRPSVDELVAAFEPAEVQTENYKWPTP